MTILLFLSGLSRNAVVVDYGEACPLLAGNYGLCQYLQCRPFILIPVHNKCLCISLMRQYYNDLEMYLVVPDVLSTEVKWATRSFITTHGFRQDWCSAIFLSVPDFLKQQVCRTHFSHLGTQSSLILTHTVIRRAFIWFALVVAELSHWKPVISGYIERGIRSFLALMSSQKGH